MRHRRFPAGLRLGFQIDQVVEPIGTLTVESPWDHSLNTENDNPLDIRSEPADSWEEIRSLNRNLCGYSRTVPENRNSHD